MVDNLDNFYWTGVISFWTSCLKSGVMGQTTGQSHRSKIRPAENFVNKCYWQYQFKLGVGEKRKSGRKEK